MTRDGIVDDKTADALRAQGEVIPIGQGRTEAQKAADYRDTILKQLNEVMDTINAARRDGLIISFQISAPDGFNRQSLALLEIVKKLC